MAAALAWGSLSLLGCGGEAEAPERRPDVVLVLLDTTRPDRIPLYGWPRPGAPFLSRVARRGVVFAEARSTSTWTAPATASLLTGLHPLAHGVTKGLLAQQEEIEAVRSRGEAEIAVKRIPASVPTAAELYSAAGYATYGVSANVNVGPEMGFDRAFDRFVRIHPRDHQRGLTAIPYGTAEAVEEVVRAWASEMEARRPFFLYLHFNDAHAPYRAMTPGTPSGEVERYESEIDYMDRVLARISSRLGLGADTLIAVASDHGEAFGEHGHRGHGRAPYEELERIALVLSYPGGGVVPGGVVTSRVGIADVLPTLLELACVPLKERLSGASLADRITGRTAGRDLDARPLVGHYQVRYPYFSVTRGRWKLLLQPDGRTELYDLLSDPGERDDVSARHPDVVEGLVEALEVLQADVVAPVEEEGTYELDPERLEELEGLGYVG